MHMSKIKICGLTREEDIQAVNQYMPDYIGFVFAKSKRQVSLEQAKFLKQQLSDQIQAVGVFVNEDKKEVLQLEEAGIIDVIQLHGQESEAEICLLKSWTSAPVIKAVHVESAEDILRWQESKADYLLLDYPGGGSGKQFDWTVIPELKKPYFLAGGIGLHNLEAALQVKPYGIDLSGGAETDGKKDSDKIREIVQLVRNVGCVPERERM